jgi:hypothetical protein
MLSSLPKPTEVPLATYRFFLRFWGEVGDLLTKPWPKANAWFNANVKDG